MPDDPAEADAHRGNPEGDAATTPSGADGVMAISPALLGYLLEGIDWRRHFMDSFLVHVFDRVVDFGIELVDGGEAPSAPQ